MMKKNLEILYQNKMRENKAHGFVANVYTIQHVGISFGKTLTFVRPRGFFRFSRPVSQQ